MTVDANQLKNFLVDSGLISKKEVESLFDEAKGDIKQFGDALIGQGKISEDDFRRAKAYVIGIPFVDLKKEKIDREVLSIIPEPVARSHNIIAFRKNETSLEVAMLDPEDLIAIEFIKKSSGLKILPRLTDTESIKNLLLQYQKSLKAEFGDIIKTESSAIEAAKGGEALVSEEDLKKLADDLPVVRIIDTLLQHAILQKASDIHIEPFEKELVVRYRIDGLLYDAMILPKNAAAGITARIKVLSNLRLDEKRLPQDGRFKIESDSHQISFRVSILPVYFGEKVVMRLLPDSVQGFTLESMGFHGLGLERIQGATRMSTGMILVTGPTGSGKTTTLYTILDILNTPDVNISTVEDPIEYQIARINQTQVKPEIGLTFASGIRSLVRQDPDIIMVGEIRDKDTAEIAVNAAMTGHLLLSTLHTNDAATAFPRLMDMGVEPFLVSSSVNIVIAQRLVRKICEKCRMSYSPGEDGLNMIEAEPILAKSIKKFFNKKDLSKITVFKGVGCKACAHTGYVGRTGLFEVMEVSEELRSLISQKSPAEVINSKAILDGMNTMVDDGVRKISQGVTTIEEVIRNINS